DAAVIDQLPAGARDGVHRMAQDRQVALEKVADVLVVVGDRDAERVRRRGRGGHVASLGISKMISVPFGRPSATETQPPCASTMFLTTAAPRPVPSARVVKNGSNKR